MRRVFDTIFGVSALVLRRSLLFMSPSFALPAVLDKITPVAGTRGKGRGVVSTFGLAHSLRLDPELFDERPKSLGIGFYQRAERFRRVLLARENLRSNIGETGSDHWVGQCLNGRRVELGDDVLRGVPLGAKNPYQLDWESAGSPISEKVGMSGATARRVSLVTA